MPPKAKTTREMLAEAAFEIARSRGAEHINARAVAQRAGCSTQPVLYRFKTVEELKAAALRRADEFHTGYITTLRGGDPLLEIGLNYIRFAVEEKHLFRFLFQSNDFSGRSLAGLVEAAAPQPVLEILAQEAQITPQQAKTVFRSLFLFAHGYAAMFANNDMEYDEAAVAADLERIFTGTLYALKEEERNGPTV